MPKVLIVPAPLFHWPGRHVEMLEGAGFEVVYPPARKSVLTEPEIIAALEGVSAVIASSESYNERVLSAARRLRVISRAGVGSDAVAIHEATKRGVVVTIAPGTNHGAVAESTMALLLALTRSVVRLDREVRAGRWPREPLCPIRGKTLGIVGLGRIGQSVAVRAAGFGVRILAYEKFPDQGFVQKHSIELADLNTLLEQADFVTLHVPLTDETRGMINHQTLARMKRGSYLVNTARGGLIVEQDLLAALRSGHLAGAGLDVFEREPAGGNPLLQLDNVIASPHVAGVDTQSLVDMANLAAQNIIDLYRGIWPETGVVNPQLREGWKW